MTAGGLDRQARDLQDALSEFIRVYQFRDRDRICCHDVSVSQCYALEVLVRRDRATLNEVAAELCLDKSTASRVVATLERKGYVARASHPSDGRAVLLAATPAGGRLYARIFDGLVAERRQILAAFPPSVREAAATLIRRLAGAARDRSGAACETNGRGRAAASSRAAGSNGRRVATSSGRSP
jgi:MarR family 2-MHQ and catechol resistance regulon transcriptional repressor